MQGNRPQCNRDGVCNRGGLSQQKTVWRRKKADGTRKMDVGEPGQRRCLSLQGVVRV